MPGINKVRIINFHYNNNRERYGDETYEMAPYSTKIHAANGFGKSVLNQVIMAPFVTASKRDRKDRPFISFFPAKQPSYVLVEWLLENGDLLITGALYVRQEEMRDDKTETKLIAIHFVGEYTPGCPYSLDKIPLVTKKEDGAVVPVSFSTARTMVAEYSRTYGKRFCGYDMDREATAYWNRLKSYGISRPIWESIIQPVNLEEESLSKFFSNSGTTHAFMRDWIIRIANEKLNENEDHYGLLRKGISDYIANFIEYKEEYQTCKDYEQYKTALENEMLPCLETWEQTESKRRTVAVKLILLKESLSTLEKEAEKTKENIEAELQVLAEKKAKAQYGILSEEYYLKKKEAELVAKEAEEIRLRAEEIKAQIDKTDNELTTISIYESLRDLDSIKAECEEIKAEIEAKEKDEQEIVEQKRILGEDLNRYYKAEEEKLKKKEETSLIKTKEIKEKLNVIEEEIEDLSGRIPEQEKELRKIQGRIDRYDAREKAYTEEYRSSLSRNMITETYPDEVLEAERRTVSDAIQKAEKELSSLKTETKTAMEEADRLKQEINTVNQNIIATEAKKENCRVQNENLTTILDRRTDDLKYIDLEEADIYDDERITKRFKEKIAEKDSMIMDLHNKSLEYEKTINEMKGILNGEPLSIPPALINEMRNAGIPTATVGMKILSDTATGEEVRLRYLENHPELPFSVVIVRSELERLRNFRGSIRPRYAIPVVIRDELEQASGNTLLYTDFDERLLDRQSVQKMAEEAMESLKAASEQAKAAKKDRDTYSSRLSVFQANPVTKAEAETVRRKLKETKEHLEKLYEEKKLTENKKEETDTLVRTLSEKIPAFTEAVAETSRREDRLNALIKDYDAYIKDLQEKAAQDDAIGKLRSLLQACSSNRDVLTAEKMDEEEELHLIRLHFRELSPSIVRFSEYKNDSKTAVLTHEDAEKYLARYNALDRNSSSELARLQERLNRKKSDMTSRRKNIDISLHAAGQDEATVRSYRYLPERRQTLYENKEELQNRYKTEEKKYRTADNKETQLKTIANEKLKQIKKETNNDAPMEMAAVTAINPKAALEEAETSIREKKATAEKTEKKISIYKTIHDNISSSLDIPDIKPSEADTLDFDPSQLDDAKLRGVHQDLRSEFWSADRGSIKAQGDAEKLLEEIGERPYAKQMRCEATRYTLRNEIRIAVEPAIGYARTLIDRLSGMVEAVKHVTEKDAEERRIHADRLYSYIRSIYKNINRIDKRSTIEMEGVRRKMFEIRQPAWDDEEAIFRAKCMELVSRITEQSADIMDPVEREKIITGLLQPASLYDDIIGIDNTKISLYKVEENRITKQVWKEVVKNSGGEGTLSAFIVLSNFMNFLTTDPEDIFADNKSHKHVLLLDNPFSKMTAKHLIQPFFAMARQTGTQLIIVSGVKEEDVNEPFERIYTLEKCIRGNKGLVYTRSVEDNLFEPSDVVHSEINEYLQTSLFDLPGFDTNKQ